MIKLIVACDLDNGIGFNGQLPWRLKADMKHVRHITTSTTDESFTNAVIMGRKTWESLPDRFKPLPDRINIVLSRTLEFTDSSKNTHSFPSLDEAISYASTQKEIEDVFIFGGGEIYREALSSKICSVIHRTVVHLNSESDTFFPEIPEGYSLVDSSEVEEEDGIRFHFEVFCLDTL